MILDETRVEGEIVLWTFPLPVDLEQKVKISIFTGKNLPPYT